MKKTGICPKCGSHEIYFNDKKFKSGDRNWLHAGITLIFITTYICLSCGYIEDYANDIEKLEKFRDKWQRWGSQIDN